MNGDNETLYTNDCMYNCNQYCCRRLCHGTIFVSKI